MSKRTTITINGRLYDAVTGTPFAADSARQHNAPSQNLSLAPKASPRAFSDIGPARVIGALTPMQRTTLSALPAQPAAPKPNAQAVHARTQKSETLYRQALKQPQSQPMPAATAQRSPLISRFAAPVLQPLQDSDESQQIAQAVKTHPLVSKVLQKNKQPAQLSSKELKEQLIKERMAEVSDKAAARRAGFWARQPRLATILASTLSLLVLGGYLTYINLPNISMKVAAARAGINASFPSYRPDGYGLNGPITYSPGQVAVSYKSNINDNGFKLTEKASNWDSQAVLDNFVSKQTSNYLTFQQHGLTIYTFANKAAWANGGILYTVDGTANLSSEQILNLATSI